MAKRNFVGVVMTGGQSRRMGTNKALLKRAGLTMAQFTQQCLLDAGASNVYFSVPQQTEDSSTISVVSDEIADLGLNLGPLGAFQAAIQQAITQQVTTPILFVPVDLPLLTADTLQLLASHDLGQDNAVSFHRQPLPVLIKPSEEVMTVLNRIISTGENLSIFHFLDNIGADAIKLKNTDALFNSNRPEEWQTAMDKINPKS